MHVPGDAWLEFVVRPPGGHRSKLVQTADFRPMPPRGRLYWAVQYPIHRAIFRGMAREIARAAEATDGPARAGRLASSP